MPYTLINQETLDEIFPECKKRGIGIIIGAPFSSGILATGVTNNAKYNYRKPSKFIVTKVNSIKNICDKHNVPLKAAAIQFPLFHPFSYNSDSRYAKSRSSQRKYFNDAV